MIADMLQLIFVGSAAFQAATQGLDGERRPEGMVLPGETLGYAFLNIQCSPKAYISIGVQLESTVRSCRLFIVHKEFGASEKGQLIPFDNPLTIRDFQHEGMILPLDDVAEQLTERGYELISPTTKNYHKLLYQNNILPLDLTYSSRILDTYAKIIQAFSRKKSLDANNPRELQNFLFGNERGGEIYKEFEKTVNELQRSEDEYRTNRTKVELIDKKGIALSALRTQQKIFKQAELTYLTTRLAYWNFQYRDRTIKLQGVLTKYSQTIADLEHCHSHCVTKYTTAEPTIKSLKDVLQSAHDHLQIVLTPYQRWETASLWLKDLDCDTSRLKELYAEQTKKNKQKTSLEQLLLGLQKENILVLFQESDWRFGVGKGKKWSENKLNTLTERIKQKEQFKLFTDLSISGSLAEWAVAYGYSLSLIQVSVLNGLRDISYIKPIAQAYERYIADPTYFFENLDSPYYESSGFWLSIGGIKYFFELEHELYKSIEVPEKRKYFFEELTTSTDIDIAKLTKEKKRIQALKELIDENETYRIGADAYASRTNFETFEMYPGFSKLAGEFTTYYECLTNADTIKTAYQDAKEAHVQATNNLNAGTLAFDRYNDKMNDIGGILSVHQQVANAIRVWQIEHEGFFSKSLLQSPTMNGGADFDVISQTIQNSHSVLLSNMVWNQLKEDWLTAKRELLQAETDYKALYQSLQNRLSPNYSPPEPSQTRDLYREAESKYKSDFNALVSLYLENNSYKLGNDYNFVELAYLLLPGLFEHEDITEEGVLSRITQRLNEINKANRALNIRKLNRIKDLLNLVEDARRTIWTTVGSMQSFFERKENEITGGYRAVLTIRDSRNFPFDWIRTFKRELANPDFAERFLDAVSLKEKIQKAFELCGGTTEKDNVQKLIQDLLNPNSYIELSYSMKSANDDRNAGSTGQTYAAIALLCIARLSLIHEKRRKGIRFMPVDEAEGLGANFDLLYRIAKQYDYQIISFSPNLVGSFDEGGQFVYMLAKDMEAPGPINHEPMGLFRESDLYNQDEDEFNDEEYSQEDTDQESREENNTGDEDSDELTDDTPTDEV
ncbi:hypothetical protein GCM10028808_27210 [Spirosoma migulaei]